MVIFPCLPFGYENFSVTSTSNIPSLNSTPITSICKSPLQIIENEIEKIISVSAAEEVEEIEITNQEENKLELAKIEEQIDRLIKSISDASAVTMKYINSEIEKLDKRKNAINKMLTKKGKAKKIEPISFKKLMFDEKKKVVQNYIERIYVYDDKIDIKWKI